MTMVNLTYLEKQAEKIATNVDAVECSLIDNLQEIVRQQQANTHALILIAETLAKIEKALIYKES